MALVVHVVPAGAFAVQLVPAVRKCLNPVPCASPLLTVKAPDADNVVNDPVLGVVAPIVVLSIVLFLSATPVNTVLAAHNSMVIFKTANKTKSLRFTFPPYTTDIGVDG